MVIVVRFTKKKESRKFRVEVLGEKSMDGRFYVKNFLPGMWLVSTSASRSAQRGGEGK